MQGKQGSLSPVVTIACSVFFYFGLLTWPDPLSLAVSLASATVFVVFLSFKKRPK